MQQTQSPQHLESEEQLLQGGKIMSLKDHLDELRARVIRSLVAIIVLFITAFAFSNKIIIFLKAPLMAALPEANRSLHFTGPMEVFMANCKVAFIASIIFGCPIWLYQFWKFLEPALYPRERKYVLPCALASILLFFMGVSFCFFIILPMTLNFLIQIGLEVGTPMITINDYLSITFMLIIAFGIVFETPLILVLLALLDLVDAKTLAEYRRFVIIIILVVAAILTPPDPISQMALAIPTYLMYEIAIIIIRMIKKKQNLPVKPSG